MNANLRTNIGILLIGYENQENLGLRSLIACLRQQGYQAELHSFFPGKDQEVLDAVRRLKPRLIGFSLIFQFTIDQFSSLMRFLRNNGITTHFTAGGHFPSLRPAETFELVPDLDSIVRFEGEETVVELYDKLDEPSEWPTIRSIAFRDGDKVVQTPLRPLIQDLDDLPVVFRDETSTTIGGIGMASMLASRGCHFNCSFCSIRQFYGISDGKLRRTRSPHHVVEEMHALFAERDVRFFSFQDDDFAFRSPNQKKWIGEFLKELRLKGLAGQIKWKISCRVDDIQPELVREMAEHGLFAVYLGVESGNEAGLKTLNKQTSVRKNLDAIDTVKQMSLALSIGFMLFDPSSTVETVSENIDFLFRVGQDGYFPINFGKMLPYAGTPVERDLQLQGRLKGPLTHPDYDFLNPDLDWYAFLVQKLFARRNFGAEGVAALQNTDFEYRIAASFGLDNSRERFEALAKNITRSNKLVVETLRSLLDAVESIGAEQLLRDEERLLAIADKEWSGEAEIREENERLRRELILALRNESGQVSA
ncbi:MAG TPA: radical SAM protein [Chlorobaculum sp.]|nr:radical SAM protein [Chlorobaculum sp.]